MVPLWRPRPSPAFAAGGRRPGKRPSAAHSSSCAASASDGAGATIAFPRQPRSLAGTRPRKAPPSGPSPSASERARSPGASLRVRSCDSLVHGGGEPRPGFRDRATCSPDDCRRSVLITVRFTTAVPFLTLSTSCSCSGPCRVTSGQLPVAGRRAKPGQVVEHEEINIQLTPEHAALDGLRGLPLP